VVFLISGKPKGFPDYGEEQCRTVRYIHESEDVAARHRLLKLATLNLSVPQVLDKKILNKYKRKYIWKYKYDS